MPKHLLPVSHQPQRNEGGCLAACVAMVLAYLGQEQSYDSLCRLLEIKPFGAPAGNVRSLINLNLTVVYSQTDIQGVETYLTKNIPVIAFVNTGELPYWSYVTDHAIVIVGYDEHHLYVNDPDRLEYPIKVLRGEFELAWLERDYYYASITN